MCVRGGGGGAGVCVVSVIVKRPVLPRYSAILFLKIQNGCPNQAR